MSFEVNIHDFLFHPNYFPCNCSNLPYVDINRDHILTRDLQPIKNNKLHKLFCKGPKYKKRTFIKFHDAKKINLV